MVKGQAVEVLHCGGNKVEQVSEGVLTMLLDKINKFWFSETGNEAAVGTFCRCGKSLGKRPVKGRSSAPNCLVPTTGKVGAKLDCSC